ncbi:LysR family transcriptional regulator [Actinocatenispora rupis]|uniref:LysR family transcriptional regulator n=1 Tax=Actinocatenispora rupis TaxID=519421 RepID=A0A8J3NG39_9ACTN|nr:LysR family transcriptional regulator [Actinocatenispora rupis]GID14444.1 LysR family transcriptional regulator [Actinocatenispora rupis]
MELRQLGHFVAAAEELHFTRAARRAHVVQSSLSSSIRALERELGGDLFVRTSRQVRLTAAGEALLPAARAALAAAQDGRDAVAGVRGVLGGRLTIGVLQTLGPVDLSALLARFHRRHPGVLLRLRNDNAPRLARDVVRGESDLAFVDHPVDTRGLREIPLGAEDLILAVPRGDPLATRRTVRLGALAGHDFVEYRPESALRRRIDAACADAGLDRRICCEVDTIAQLVDLVAHGMGVALLPPLTVRGADGVAAVPTEPAVRRELVAVTAADRPVTPAAAALLDLLP